ncbi:MAG: Hpt domain-containing protein [Spirochaetaceae bacterium]|jgi:HPt (histidine-containing phosphotransfer) domain-containing protein|nr:Hpt domain-containing protein [Spirochaetaceae bacterium]
MLINETDGTQRVMGNAALYTKLLRKCVDENYMQPIEDGYAAGDAEKAELAIHTLKGISANLSLEDLNKVCVEVEINTKAGKLEQDDLEKLKKIYNETVDAINGRK